MNTHALAITLIALIGGGPVAVGNAYASEREPKPPLLAATAGSPAPRLLATFVHPQAQRSMAMVSAAGAATVTVQVGQELDNGLRVQAIARDHLVVARGTQRFTLPLWGQAATRKAPAHLAPGNAAPHRGGNAAVTTNPASAAHSPQLRAGNLNDVRAACADPALMQALPEVQKMELAASGVCNTH